MTGILHLITEHNNTFLRELPITSDGQVIYPRMGEAIVHEDVRYIVVDVSWNLDLSKVAVVALYQEPDD